MEEISKLFECNALGSEPYQRLSNLMQHNFSNNFWNEHNENKKMIIFEGFKYLFNHQENKNTNIYILFNKINQIIMKIYNAKDIEKLPAPEIPHSKARDLNGFSQRELMKIISKENLKLSIELFNYLLNRIFLSKNKELFFHRTTKTFFIKKKII